MQNYSEIDEIENLMINAGLYSEEDGDAEFLFGVIMEHDGENVILELKQTGLTDWIIEYLGFYVRTKKVKWEPAGNTLLINDEYGEPPTGYFVYRSVVGVILYLAGHAILNIA